MEEDTDAQARSDGHTLGLALLLEALNKPCDCEIAGRARYQECRRPLVRWWREDLTWKPSLFSYRAPTVPSKIAVLDVWRGAYGARANAPASMARYLARLRTTVLEKRDFTCELCGHRTKSRYRRTAPGRGTNTIGVGIRPSTDGPLSAICKRCAEANGVEMLVA